MCKADCAVRSMIPIRFRTESAPLEARPLGHSINELLGRLRSDIEAQNRFVANAAHQLRTPLAGLKDIYWVVARLC